MVSGAFVETLADRCQLVVTEGELPVARNRALILIGMIAAVSALATGCATKPKLPPGVHPSVEVGPPLKSEAWKHVATAADQDRLERLGLAWQEALDDARSAKPADGRKEGGLRVAGSGRPPP